MIKALPGYVIISPIEEELRTSSGLVVSTPKDRPVKGKVVDVGGQTATEGPQVDVDDIVYYRKWSGDEIKQGDRELRVVAFKDCVAREVY